MNRMINKDELFGNEYRAVILCEYTRDMCLLKKLIEIAEQRVQKHQPKDTWSFEGICYLFARTIVDNSKMSYDNMMMGHFDAANMINRTIIENNVCLDLIISRANEELWRYYLVHSYKNSIIKSKEAETPDHLAFLEKLYQNHNIDKEFFEKHEDERDKRAYIDRPYGWSYKFNDRFSFKGLCRFVDDTAYDGFSMMSDYSHGTAIHLKIGSSVSIDHIMNMLSALYIGLYRMVTLYCWDPIEDGFDEVTEEIESILYDYIESSEELFQ